MNTKNSNAVFQDFSKCDFNKHWSYSNFFRHLIVCEQLNKLSYGAVIIELGAGDSPISKMMEDNFHRRDLMFIKYDGDNKYIGTDIMVCDIMQEPFSPAEVDCVIFTEVIEHLEKQDRQKIIKKIFDSLAFEGVLIVSTPTPPFNGSLEDRVWPQDHKSEMLRESVYKMLNIYFKVNQQVGWSIEEREMNTLLLNNEFIQKIYCNLKGKLPESMIRALIPFFIDEEYSRQVLFICKKRRERISLELRI